MGKWIVRLMILIYIICLIYSNDKIARQEGSSLGEQIMLILAAVGVYFIITKIVKKKD
jgi:hypothetical protein